MTAVPCPELSVPTLDVPTMIRGSGTGRKWWHTLFAIKRRTNETEWRNALPALLAMDSRLLDDIGAPDWVIAEVTQRQQRRASDVEDVLSGRYGCAGARRF